jgi:hypothetical protein
MKDSSASFLTATHVCRHKIRFSSKHSCVIVYKGGIPALLTPDGNYWFNTRGIPVWPKEEAVMYLPA